MPRLSACRHRANTQEGSLHPPWTLHRIRAHRGGKTLRKPTQQHGPDTFAGSGHGDLAMWDTVPLSHTYRSIQSMTFSWAGNTIHPTWCSFHGPAKGQSSRYRTWNTPGYSQVSLFTLVSEGIRHTASVELAGTKSPQASNCHRFWPLV